MASLPTRDPITPEKILQYQGEGVIEFVQGRLVGKPGSIESSEIEGTIFTLLRAEAVRTRGCGFSVQHGVPVLPG